MHTPIILVADDDADALLCLKHAFRRTHVYCPIFCVDDGDGVVAYLDGKKPFSDRKNFPLPTLLILQLSMPYRSGLDVLKWVRADERFRALPVVILSQPESTDQRRALMEAGATDFLIKPASFEALCEMVVGIHHGGIRRSFDEKEVATEATSPGRGRNPLFWG